MVVGCVIARAAVAVLVIVVVVVVVVLQALLLIQKLQDLKFLAILVWVVHCRFLSLFEMSLLPVELFQLYL